MQDLTPLFHNLSMGTDAVVTGRRERVQSPGEEIANTVTHGIGAALGVAALVVLVVFASLRGDAWRVVSLSIYGTTLVLLYLASTLYHAFRGRRIQRLFQIVDHTAIYLLIAGTYTPVTLVHMRGPWGWTLFGLIWGLALAGIVSKTFIRKRVPGLSVAFYVAMGWLALIALQPILRTVPHGLLAWIVAGGVCYTLGVAFFAWERLPYHHAVWHLFVLAGSGCHFFGMLFHLTARG